MTGELTDARRRVIAQLAAEILPGTATQPAAVDIGIDDEAIDRALRSRADLAPGFCQLLDRYTGDADVFLETLDDPDYDLLLTLICAAYVMAPAVRRALGYDGQQALTPNRGGFGAEELVMEMLQQPKRYRRA